MLELFASYSVGQILIFLIMFALALKECFTLIDFFMKKLKNIFDKENKEKDFKEEILERIDSLEQSYKKDVHFLSDQLKDLQEGYKENTARLQLLTRSDRDNIKSWIVEKYHFFAEEQKWIDDFSMDTIEKRFYNYEEEGGNAYVHGLMEKLRALPNIPPANEEE